MNIDDRLEALTQTVELLASIFKDHELAQKDWDAKLDVRSASMDARAVKIDALHSDMMLAIARLANTADAHNGQLTDHDERIDRLEGR